MSCRITVAAAALLVVLTSNTAAQWLNYPTPGIPRLPNGQANLNAPGPRLPDGKPDLTGMWRETGEGDRRLYWNLARNLLSGQIRMTPWAVGVQKQRESRQWVDDPGAYCLPHGVPRILFASGSAGFKFVATPGAIISLHEASTYNTFRQIYTDGRPLPSDPQPSWFGYSIGRWDGDTFVVTTNGFRDGGWLDTQKGHPHSDALTVMERYRRTSFGKLEAEITIDDPKAYLEPWTVHVDFVLQPDTDLLESTCESHMNTMVHRTTAPPPPEPPSSPSPLDSKQ